MVGPRPLDAEGVLVVYHIFKHFKKNNNNNNRISVKQSKMSTHMEIEFWSLKAGGEDRH